MKALLVALLLTAQPVHAEAPEAELTPAEAYARDVTLMFFYHEMGHALIDVLDAPVLGLEEDAADMLSVLLIDRYWEPDWAEEKARAAADFWAESAPSWAEEDPGEVVTWDTHSPDERRYFTFVCLFYGGNPEARKAFATDMDLPEDRKETCPSEFDLMAQSWDQFLDQVAGSGQTLTFMSKVEGYDFISKALSDEIAYMNERLKLPQTVPVVLESCGEANAWYDPETVKITICTELVDEAMAFAVLEHP
jgi:Putative metallopeptidase